MPRFHSKTLVLKTLMSPLAVVLAAGKGTRMKSDLPKVLFPVCGRPMIDYVLDALAAGGVGRDHRRRRLSGRTGPRGHSTAAPDVEFALQTEQLGTGHAVMACRELLAEHDGPVLVVTGDAPLMQASIRAALLADYRRGRPAPASSAPPTRTNPSGLGRILRDADGQLRRHRRRARRHGRAAPDHRSEHELLRVRLPRPARRARPHPPDNAQGEYYITDVPGLLVAQGKGSRPSAGSEPCERLASTPSRSWRRSKRNCVR